jgi:hypothetical protein
VVEAEEAQRGLEMAVAMVPVTVEVEDAEAGDNLKRKEVKHEEKSITDICNYQSTLGSHPVPDGRM